MPMIRMNAPLSPYDVLSEVQKKLDDVRTALGLANVVDALRSIFKDGGVADGNDTVLNALEVVLNANALKKANVLEAVCGMLDGAGRNKLHEIESLIAEAKEYPGAKRAPCGFRDDEHEIKIRIDLPGHSADEVEAHWEEKQVLIITCRKTREEKEEEWEGPTIGHSYLLELPLECKKEGMKAQVKNGVLFLSIPKVEA